MKTITRLSSVALALLATSLAGCNKEQTTSTTETVASSPQTTTSTSGSFPAQAPVSTAPALPVSATAAQTPPFQLKAVNVNSKTAPAVQAPEDIITALAKVPRISPADLKSEVDAGKVLVLDVRAGAYAEGHIAGARHIPLVDLPQSIGSLPKNKKIITYCA